MVQCAVQVKMTDCVIAADGYSYERSAIASWLQDNSDSPVTGNPLPHNHVLPNLALKSAMSIHI